MSADSLDCDYFVEDNTANDDRIENTTNIKSNSKSSSSLSVSNKRKRESDDSNTATPLKIHSAQQLQEHIWKSYCFDKQRKWTELERNDAEKIYKIPTDCMLMPSNVDDSSSMSDYLTDLLGGTKGVRQRFKSAEKGKPRVVIICSSAIRCTEMIRATKDLFAGCKVGKLFSKHFKVQEQVQFLRNNLIHIGIGTPNRLYKLDEEMSKNLL